MHRLIILIALFFIGQGSIQGQEFMFTMIFRDSLGNSDTLELGYDDNATEGIDSQFGELNIMNTPWDSTFEVRITSELRPPDADPIENFHSKRQIIPKECNYIFPPIIEIDIKAIHWPVTANWNSSLFQDHCNEGSLITSIVPGGWWDVGSPSDLDRVLLQDTTTVTFTANVHPDGSVNHNYAYIDSTGSVISVFWAAFGIENIGVSVKEIPKYPELQIYPNPVLDEVSILGFPKGIISKIELHTINGNKVMEKYSDNFSIKKLEPGVYIISIVDQIGNRTSSKLVKN